MAIYQLGGQSPTLITSTTINSAPMGGGSDHVLTSISNLVLAPGNYQITVDGYSASNGDYNPDQGGSATVNFDNKGGALTQVFAYYNYPATGGAATTLDVPPSLTVMPTRPAPSTESPYPNPRPGRR